MSKKDSKFEGVNDNFLSREINSKKGIGKPSFELIGDWRREYNALGYLCTFEDFKKMKTKAWRKENRKRRKYWANRNKINEFYDVHSTKNME